MTQRPKFNPVLLGEPDLVIKFSHFKSGVMAVAQWAGSDIVGIAVIPGYCRISFSYLEKAALKDLNRNLARKFFSL